MNAGEIRAQVNAAVLSVHGEPVTLTVQGENHALTGLFRAPRRSLAMGGVQTLPSEPEVRIPDAGLEGLGDLAGAAVVVRGRQFTVGRSLPGDDGLTALELQEVFP